MAFIDTDTIDDAIGAPTRNKITGSDSATLTRLITAADTRARQDLKHAGYTLDPATTLVADTPIVVQHASIGYFLKMGLPRVGLPVSAHYEVYTAVGEGIRKGEIVPEGIEPDPAEGVGGVLFSESDITVDTDSEYYQVFSREKLSSW